MITRRQISFIYCLLSGWLAVSAEIAAAGELSLRLSAKVEQPEPVVQNGQWVVVGVENTGREQISWLEIVVELGGGRERVELADPIAPGQVVNQRIPVQRPNNPGSYPVVVTARYFNNGIPVSVNHVAYFHNTYSQDTSSHNGVSAVISDSCRVSSVNVRDRGYLRVDAVSKGELRIIAPAELVLSLFSETRTGEGVSRRYRVENRSTPLKISSDLYCVVEEVAADGVHRVGIGSSRISATASFKQSRYFPTWLLVLVAAGACCLQGVGLARRKGLLVARWAFTLLLVSVMLIFYRAAWVVPVELFELVKLMGAGDPAAATLYSVFEWMHFDTEGYSLFFKFIQDPLMLYALVFNYFILKWLVRPSLSDDKYSHLMVWIWRAVGMRALPVVDPLQVKSAARALLVKGFFFPLMVGWFLERVMTFSVPSPFSWAAVSPITFLISICLLIDLAVFTFGYMIELPQLKNQIRSVEPTILGWIVCMICYPPINELMFLLFDIPLFANGAGVERSVGQDPGAALGVSILDAIQTPAAVAIGVLWIIYTWATLALGAKASNLTNRGIVATGPYRFVRHPAYAAKIGVWVLTGICLGEKSFFLVCTLCLIYLLRAWTEERHLGSDQQYVDYCAKVRWTFVPGVY